LSAFPTLQIWAIWRAHQQLAPFDANTRAQLQQRVLARTLMHGRRAWRAEYVSSEMHARGRL
jgi:hypothetical protein